MTERRLQTFSSRQFAGIGGEVGGFVLQKAFVVGPEIGASRGIVGEVQHLVRILGEVVPLVFLVGERIRIMLDSTKLLYEPATMRNYTMSEYILKPLP